MRLFYLFAAALFLAASAQAEERFPDIPRSQMSPEQKAVIDAIASGPRKNSSGPFATWLVSPVLAKRLADVGEYVRFKTSLPPRLNEFAILLAGRFWTSQFEWAYHYPLAQKAGVAPSVLADLAADRPPQGMSAEEAVVYRFVTELRRDKGVSDETFATAEVMLGKRGVVDLVALTGYYDTVCMTLNVARVPVPPGSTAPPLQSARDTKKF